MTGVGGEPRTQSEFITDTRKRLTSLERQLSRQGAIDLSQRIVAGSNITIVGDGSIADPMVISSSGGGVTTPPLPAPQSSARASASQVNWTASTWQNVSGVTALTLTPEFDLWVSVDFTAMGQASAGYVAVGVALSGGVNEVPPDDPLSGQVGAWGQSPFGMATSYQAISGHKVFMIPGGETTTFTLQALRNSGTGTQFINYPILQVTPLYWDGSPGLATAGVDWGDISNKPGTFPPSAHTHEIADVTDLQTALDAKAALVHTHAISDTTGLQSALDAKAAASHTHPSSQITDFSTAVPAAVPAASQTAQGKIEIATNAEVQAGSDSVRAVTPAGLASRTATESRTGIVELATTAEATAGSDTTRAVTPAGVKAVGDTKAPISHTHAAGDTTSGVFSIARIPTGTTGSTVALGDHTHTPEAIGAIPAFFDPGADRIVFWDDSVGEFAPLGYGTGLAISGTTLNATPASTSAQGVVELATSAEALAGTDATRAITPATLAAVASTLGSGNETIPGAQLNVEIDPTKWSGKAGERLTIPTHVSPAGGQTTHPSVLFFPDGWNGYRYWMGHTPYPGGNDDHEDPNIAVSNDGITWIAAPGVTQPLDNADGTPEYNSDVNLVMGPEGEMYCFWRFYDSSLGSNQEKIYFRYSTDGVNWSTKALAYQVSQTVRRIVSPSITWIQDEQRWVMYGVDIVPSPNRIVRMYSTGASPTAWATPTDCTVTGLPSGKEPWHMEVRQISGQWIGLLADCELDASGSNGELYIIVSNDGTSFTSSGRSVVPQSVPGEHDYLYKASFVLEVVDGIIGMRVWYSAWTSGGVWNVYRTAVLPELTAPPAGGSTWQILTPSASSGSVQADGSILFSGASIATADGVFSSAYRYYKIIFDIEVGATMGGLWINFRTGGADNLTANYHVTRHYGVVGTAFVVSGVAATNLEIGGATSDYHTGELTVWNPARTKPTRLNGTSSSRAGDYYVPVNIAGAFTQNTVFDGFRFTTTSGGGRTMTGYVTVYGMV